MAGVQRGEAQHVVAAQFEVEDGLIFPHPFGAHGFHQRDDVTLIEPAQCHLSRRFAVFLADFDEQRLVEEVVFALGE